MALDLIGDPCAFFEGGSPHAGIAAHAQAAAPITPLSANDVSWLFPAPTRFEDGISMGDLAAPNPQDPTKRDLIWSDQAFRQFLDIATGPAGRVAGTAQRIGLPDEAFDRANWYIAGVRFDPGAPGLSPEIRQQFGRELQIRLVVQPVKLNDNGTIKGVYDIAAHLVFEFTTGKDDLAAQEGFFPRPQADLESFRTVVRELADLRTRLSNGELGAPIETSDKPLGVHPGLRDPRTVGSVRNAMKEILENHLSYRHLGFMTITATPVGPLKNTWIFLAMINPKLHTYYPSFPDFGFVPLPGTTLDGQNYAQSFNPANPNRVIPSPSPMNDSRIMTCKHAALPVAFPPIEGRQGISTAELFSTKPTADSLKKIVDRIADPARSHFFNTDCVSCHTETGRRMDLAKDVGLDITEDIKGIDPHALCQPIPSPGCTWNLRNFGWSPHLIGVKPTVTVRTAVETDAVVKFINAYLRLIAK